MAQDVIDSLQTLCDRLREKLMLQPEYRALISLEKTIQELSGCMEQFAEPAMEIMPAFAEEPSFTPPAEQRGIDASAMSMRQGASKVADVLADALNERKQITRTADHLPSHRVA